MIWKGLTRAEAGPLKMLVSFGGDLRGGRAENYSVMVRRSRSYEASDTLWNCGQPNEPLSFDCTTQANISVAECEALKAIYSASETKWGNSIGWLSDPDPCTWFGVECHEGSVSGLSLFPLEFTGRIPMEVTQLTGLRTLELGGSGVTGSIPVELANLSELRVLRLRYTGLSGPIPPELGNLTHLTELALQGSRHLSGVIPPELGRLVNLERLWLSSNRLTGAIPPEIGSLTELRELALGYNEFSGAIPPALEKLSRLTYLDLGVNKLRGPIPPFLGTLADLHTLRLEQNELSGPIPAELGGAQALEWLDLSRNRLGGVVPLPVAQLGGRIQGESEAVGRVCHFVYDAEPTSLTIPGTGAYVDADLDGDGAICGLDLDFPMASMVVNPGNVSFLVGGEQQLTATALDVRGVPMKKVVLNQDVDHVALLVDGPPEVVSLTPDLPGATCRPVDPGGAGASGRIRVRTSGTTAARSHS